MNWKTFALRFIGLVIVALAAGPLYAVTVHLLVLSGLIPENLMDKAYGSALMSKSAFIWMGALLLGFCSIFLKDSWRYILYFSPLYAPALFAVVYTALQ